MENLLFLGVPVLKHIGYAARNVQCSCVITFKNEISFEEKVYNKQIINTVP